jgi:hypothetical protein
MTPEQITAIMVAKLRASGWRVSLAKRRPRGYGIPRGAHGSTMGQTGLVWIEKRDPELMALTLLHESAHVLSIPMIAGELDGTRADGEVVAEAAAMLAGEEFGIRDPDSDSYIEEWMAGAILSTETLAEITLVVARELISTIEEGARS